MDLAPSPLAVPRSPESLRRRQRDRLSPRRAFANSSRPVTSITSAAAAAGTAANAREMGASPDTTARSHARLRPLQDGLRRENSIQQRLKRERERERERDGERQRRRDKDSNNNNDKEGDTLRDPEEHSKYDSPSDAGAAAREGRPFTVSNVGNNGRIYLRPTIRPANQRYAYPQAHPSTAFPITPPSTAGLDVLVSLHEEGEGDTPSDSVWTPAHPPSNLQGKGKQPVDYFLRTPPHLPQQHSRHKRAHSCSTVDEHGSVPGPEPGVFKVVIERPATERAEEEEGVPGGIPSLEVPIPSYKLGTPRFSIRGTPFFRGSSYSSSADDMRSSTRDLSHRDASSHAHSRIHSRRHSDASSLPYYPHMPQSSGYASSFIPPPGLIRHSTTLAPEIFDALTFKPACDHPSVVRYAADGSIRAATPLRLVAEITSPTFVDYHLLSDFFLTFRAYMDPIDLLYMLLARLRWAFARDDGPGMVVRVRTFVALRHWILNYFPDDYVVDYDLRKTFCDLLNSFVNQLSSDPSRSRVSLKILGELKKCWRRVCALFWDGAEFDPDINPDYPVHPGGLPGSRDSTLDPDTGEVVPATAPRLDVVLQSDFMEPEAPAEEIGMAFSESPRYHYAGPAAAQGTPGMQPQTPDARPLSPSSIMSEDVISCSLPSRARLVGVPYTPHPVPAIPIFDPAPPVATTPKALIGKRVRPSHSHKRSGSLSDSSRDTPTQSHAHYDMNKGTDSPPSILYAGSLVRGNLFPPGQATVDIIAPGTPANDISPSAPFSGSANQRGPSAMSGPGMKKLLGSVRRALSTKTGSAPNSSPTQGSFPNIPPLGVRGATVNRLPGTAIVPQARPRHMAPMRIDILGAEVAEDFKRAVREDAEADAEQRESEHDSVHNAHMLQDSALEPAIFLSPRAPLSTLTNGSKSIVIVDDTMELQLPASKSVDTFTDPFMLPSGGPTPPTTPPEVTAGTPRRSSHLLGEHTRTNSEESHEPMPPLASELIDSRTSVDDERSPNNRPWRRPSLRSRAFSASQRSVSLRRYASYQSGFHRHKSERSFDATTISESEGPERQASSILPRRILRRRPGGDLRAVNNVGDLNTQTLRRPMSTGSLATFTDSARSSFLIDGGDYDQPTLNAQTFSVGALAEVTPETRVSLFSTHSSQPVMRPSFEKEAQMLAQIPDDVDDDGGVESALLKLEGKYERRSDISRDGMLLDLAGAHNSFGPVPNDVNVVHEEGEKRKHRQGKILPALVTALPIQSNTPEDEEELQPTVYHEETPETLSPKSPRLVESYNSIPLLDRSPSDESMLRRTRDWSEHSILRGPSEERPHDEHTPVASHHSSFNFIYQAEAVKEARLDVNTSHESRDDSFLESDSDARSDLSSELSLEVISRTEYTEHDSTSTHTFPPLLPGTVMKELALPSHPLRQPPSPPITLQQALLLTPEGAILPQIHEEQHQQQVQTQYSPPKDPVQRGLVIDFNTDRIASPSMDPLRAHLLLEASRKTAVHLPFTLAFDSQVLAQQFTLIEKDALNEVDWKDLIEMRWKNSSSDSRSWVEFLRTSEPRGVEVVIARFNLMVKWAISECVLTEDLRERVQCISKFIHIADHCRKYRNFATLTQLTIALTSNEIGGLSKTWAHVPAADIHTLRQLEILIAPTSNFYCLRAEMEGSNADQGCIPFLGIYTHDLLVNLDRPSQIASTPMTEPLINFERYRLDAMIVKNLLRLLESSQLYRFLPIEGITERCLWMAALTDAEIARYGAMIEA